MNEHQIKLGRHALGLDGTNTKSYRNYYLASRNTENFREWKNMVWEGNAVRIKRAKTPDLMIELESFKLTLHGAKQCLLPAESLDKEDFSNA